MAISVDKFSFLFDHLWDLTPTTSQKMFYLTKIQESLKKKESAAWLISCGHKKPRLSKLPISVSLLGSPEGFLNGTGILMGTDIQVILLQGLKTLRKWNEQSFLSPRKFTFWLSEACHQFPALLLKLQNFLFTIAFKPEASLPSKCFCITWEITTSRCLQNGISHPVTLLKEMLLRNWAEKKKNQNTKRCCSFCQSMGQGWNRK